MTAEQAGKDRRVSIARRPVFDGRGHVWGYELFCVGESCAPFDGEPEPGDTAVSVASSAYLCLQRILQGGKRILVDFSEKGVLDKLPYVLPPLLSAIKVGEDSVQQPASMEILTRLKLDGYPIAIRNFTGNPECAALYKLASILAIEIRREDVDSVQACLAHAGQYGAMLLASEVDDRALYESCREMKFSLFSGPFFKFPDKMTIRTLSSNEILRFRLLRFLETEDPDMRKMVEAIQTDATISLRLLAFLNSAAFAFTQRIQSIRQAVSLLGWRQVRNWLRVILLTDLSQSREAGELVLLSAQRGMFLESVAREHDFWGFNPGSLHLLGLFSLLDTLLSLPMAEIVGHLPIENKLKAALCRESNNEYAPLLRLAQCFEDARWTEGDAMIQQLNLDKAKVMAAFSQSVDWAAGLDSLRPEQT